MAWVVGFEEEEIGWTCEGTSSRVGAGALRVSEGIPTEGI
jgi:hypothetical protein